MQRDRNWAIVFIMIAFFSLPALLVIVGCFSSTTNSAGRIGQAAGVAAVSFLFLTTLLPARLKVLERKTGQDILIKAHRLCAFLSLLCVVAHVVFVNVGQLFPGKSAAPVWALPLGQITALCIFGGIVGAALANKIFPDYLKWRFIHRFLGVLVISAALHGLFLGSHLAVAPMRIVFILVAVLSLLFTLYRRVYASCISLRSYETISVRRASKNEKAWTLTLKANGTPLPIHEPGQFGFFTFAPGGMSGEEHPFSFSSPHGEEKCQITIRAVGDFTNQVSQTKAGDIVAIDGPYGSFGHNLAEAPSFLFIAGGIGVTPLFSMYEHLQRQNDERKGLFLRAAREEDDLVFSDALKKPFGNWQQKVVLSKPKEDWSGLCGHIDEEFLKAEAADYLSDSFVYLCGPPAMMQDVQKALTNLGVDECRINFERFTFP